MTLAHPDAGLIPARRQSRGQTIRYLPVAVRADGKPIALAEVLIGPDQDTEVGIARVRRLLAECGYHVGRSEYPRRIAGSEAEPRFR